MPTLWNKLDSGLSSIYSNYLRVRERGPAGVGRVHEVVAAGGILNVSLQYTGDLAAIEAVGFATIWRQGPGRASGTIDLAQLERLAAHPGVEKLSFGSEREPTLDQSVPDVRANQVWSVSSGAFSGSTGTGVIVGVIDTGIDVHHPFFKKANGETRILRIWDPGLPLEAGDSSPNAARLSAGGPSYGVEYDKAKIMAALGGVGSFRHKDCNGHGTHVASIAAGNGRDEFRFIGVAPEAELIVVKYLYLQTHPRVGAPAAPVPYDQIFRDAISYILNVAQHDFGRPVVINYSVGTMLGPHDGFTDDEDFLTATFLGATGKAFVSSAGNSGGKRQHARIVFPAGGATVQIPFRLYDSRTNKQDYNYCEWRPATRDLKIHCYYPRGGATFSAELDVPADGAGFLAGPALGAAEVTGAFGGGKQYALRHREDNQTLARTGRGTVNRNLFEVEIEAHNNEHRVGAYLLRATSSDALTVHVWCQQARGHGFKIDTTPPLPAAVTVEDRFLIGSDGGADGIVTVAAYDAEHASGSDPVTSFSSRGPLVSYGGPAQPDKPDLGAPGKSIDAARSREAKPKQKKTSTEAKQGTSMSAPHVAGAVALMLQKNPALTVAQILSTLKTHRRPRVGGETAEELGAGRLDAKAAFDNAP